MSLKRIRAITRRIIRQFVRDRRTLALIFLVPVVLMTLIAFSFPETIGTGVLSYIAPALLALMAVFFGFILTGVSFLRERSQGTLERLMASPVSSGDLAIGYLTGFLVFAMVQSIIVLLFTVYVLDIQYHGDLWQIFVLQILSTIGAVNLGILVSTYAHNEFQVVQFIPLFILPQVFLSGVLWPVEQMNIVLQWIAKFLPLTYAIQGLRDIMLNGMSLVDLPLEVGVLCAFAIAASIGAVFTLRRK